MKKLFLSLMATVLFVCSGNAQNGSFSKSAMAVVVTAAKTTFTKGTTYRDWLVTQVGTTVPSKEEDRFLNDVYNFVSMGATSETILRSYDGKSFANLGPLSGNGGLKVIHEGTVTSTRGWCIPCLIKLLVDLACEIIDCTSPVIPNNPAP